MPEDISHNEHLLRHEARLVASQCHAAPVRVEKIMRATARTFDDQDVFKSDRHRTLTLGQFFHGPDLRDALKYLSPDQALVLFEAEDLTALNRRVRAGAALADKAEPLYTLAELAEATQAAIQYLGSHRDDLREHGIPQIPFTASAFLDQHLIQAYFSQKAGPRQPTEGGVPPTTNPFPRNAVLTEFDTEEIRSRRDRLNEAKRAVLNLCAKAVISRNAEGLANECFGILKQRLSPSEIEFHLENDLIWRGYNALGGELPYGRKVAHAGGLSDLVQVIGHFVSELTVGTYWKTRAAFGDAIPPWTLGGIEQPRMNYFQAVKAGKRAQYDRALDLYGELVPDEVVVWEDLYSLFRKSFGSERPADVASSSNTVQVRVSNVWRKIGSGWVVQYKGRDPIFLSSKSAAYIAHMIARPNKPFHCTDLQRLAEGIHAAPESPCLDAGDLSIGGIEGDDDTVSESTLKHLRKRMEQLPEIIAKAETQGLASVARKHQDELDAATAFIRKNTARNGRPRQHGPSEKARVAVRKGLVRLNNEIKRSDPDLAAHLRESIKTSWQCVYAPADKTRWMVAL